MLDPSVQRLAVDGHEATERHREHLCRFLAESLPLPRERLGRGRLLEPERDGAGGGQDDGLQIVDARAVRREAVPGAGRLVEELELGRGEVDLVIDPRERVAFDGRNARVLAAPAFVTPDGIGREIRGREVHQASHGTKVMS